MLSSDLVRSVLDSAPDAMIIIDSSGKILFANRQVTALFGHESQDIVGGPIEVLLPERFRQRHVGHRSGYTNNVRVRPMGMGLDLYGMRKDGSEFPVEISLSPISQGSEFMVAAAIRDVTERKQVEQALKEARREAEHANLAKSRFLATASHDLRQPLQTLGLLNGALRRMLKDPDSLEVLEQQELATDGMARLLNALLDISKLESGAIQLDLMDFAVAPLFEQMRGEFASVATAKGLRFSIDAAPASVNSDPALIGQVLRNLISNAIKYTPHGAIELRCERIAEAVRIEVRDSGVGIATEQLKFIFDEFYQVGVSPNSSREGYGLGLSIVQRISKLLGLDINVASEPGKGSIFSFELPLAVSEPANGGGARTREHAVPAPAVGAPQILLVEDEPGVRNAMRMLLKIAGYRVDALPSVEAALAHLAGKPHVDLIVTDYHLEGGRTGTEVIAAARATLGDDARAILVTGDTSSAVREMSGDPNLRITSKPINSDELLALVKELIRS
jgi:PAS domain S-box-containing protein